MAADACRSPVPMRDSRIEACVPRRGGQMRWKAEPEQEGRQMGNSTTRTLSSPVASAMCHARIPEADPPVLGEHSPCTEHWPPSASQTSCHGENMRAPCSCSLSRAPAQENSPKYRDTVHVSSPFSSWPRSGFRALVGLFRVRYIKQVLTSPHFASKSMSLAGKLEP